MHTHSRKLLAAIAALFLLAGCAGAPPAPAADNSRPSEESVKTLLEVSEVRKTVDSMMSNMDSMMKSSIQNSLQGKTLTADQQRICDAAVAKMEAQVRQDLAWESLEPIYIRIYRDSLTQSDVDGITAFYKSPAGQATIKKMPLLMQNTMKEVQARMPALMESIRKITQEAATELKADDAKPPQAPQRPPHTPQRPPQSST